jgi:hypothetical protein
VTEMDRVGRATLRANPGYELVLLDRLTPAERELLGSAGADAETYGVLRPRAGAGLLPRAASPDTALLFLTLREPAPLPAYARAQLGADADRVVARLVVDGVLQIAAGGAFGSNLRLAGIAVSTRPAGGSGRIGELSRAALDYGQELACAGMREQQLAVRLYSYGRRPVTPELCRRFGGAGAIDVRLGIDDRGTARRALDAGWAAAPAQPGERPYWRSWQARCAAPGQVVGYKLYVSPAVDAIGDAFAAVVGSLAAVPGVIAFKVGAGVAGLCRPDKLVVYFDRLDDLQAGAARLRTELAGCPAHGVPFTAAVTCDGLLSWGVDPPDGGQGRTSWRLWVCERLAEYLMPSDHAGLEPSEFALERLRLAGIDADTWIPGSGMWARALAEA